MTPFRNHADARELPSRWKVQVLDAGVDDISVDDIISDPWKRISRLRLSESKLWVLTHLCASSNFLGCLSMRRKQVNKTERKRT